MARIVAVCISENKGVPKTDRGNGTLVREHGLATDAHAGDWHRQVSLLSTESIDKMRQMGLDVGPGDFAENLTVSGMVLHVLPVGTRLLIGGEEGAVLEITQIGKECHTKCAIFHQVGECIMPSEGIFARVLVGGEVSEGDLVSAVKIGSSV